MRWPRFQRLQGRRPRRRRAARTGRRERGRSPRASSWGQLSPVARSHDRLPLTFLLAAARSVELALVHHQDTIAHAENLFEIAQIISTARPRRANRSRGRRSSLLAPMPTPRVSSSRMRTRGRACSSHSSPRTTSVGCRRAEQTDFLDATSRCPHLELRSTSSFVRRLVRCFPEHQLSWLARSRFGRLRLTCSDAVRDESGPRSGDPQESRKISWPTHFVPEPADGGSTGRRSPDRIPRSRWRMPNDRHRQSPGPSGTDEPRHADDLAAAACRSICGALVRRPVEVAAWAPRRSGCESGRVLEELLELPASVIRVRHDRVVADLEGRGSCARRFGRGADDDLIGDHLDFSADARYRRRFLAEIRRGP